MRRISVIIIAVALFCTHIYADLSSPYLGVKGANFLKIGLSPRAEAMGSSYVSYGTGDINSLYYNPAGLAGMKDMEFQFSTLDWIDNVTINYLAFASPFEKIRGVFSSSFTLLYLSPITYYNDWGEDIGALSFYNLAFSTGYSKRFGNYHTGINIKYLFQKIAYKKNTGVAFDFGIIHKASPFAINLMNKYLVVVRNFNVGLALKNIGTKAGADELPTSLEFGYSVGLFRNLNFSLTIIKPVYVMKSLLDSDYKVNLGFEYLFKKILYIRNGYKLNYDIPNNFTTGFGVRTEFFNGIIEADYAYAAYTYLEKTNKISIILRVKNLLFWETDNKK